MPVPRRLVERLDALIRDAYDQAGLKRLLKYKLDARLDRVAPAAADFDAVVLSVVEWAEQKGRLVELAAAVAEDLPQRSDAAELAREIATAAGPVEGGARRRRPDPGWRWVSTLASSHRGEVSVLAVAETVGAVWVSLWVAVRYETVVHIAVSAVLASMLLFRTRQSDRLCLTRADRSFGFADAEQLSPIFADVRVDLGVERVPLLGRWPVSILEMILWITTPLWLAGIGYFTIGVGVSMAGLALAHRLVALVISFTRTPLTHLVAVRKNWRRIALATDSNTLPELLPGVGLLSEQSALRRGLWVWTFPGAWNRSRPRSWRAGELFLLNCYRAYAVICLYGFPVVQRLSFKSVSYLFLPFLLVVNSDMVRPDLTLLDRLKEIRRDSISWLKFAYALAVVGVVGGGLFVKGFAPWLSGLAVEYLSEAGQVLCAYYLPPGGFAGVKAWQVAMLLNAALFVPLLLVYVPRMIRRAEFENPAWWVPRVKAFLFRADVVAATLSLYAVACGLAILLEFVVHGRLPPPHERWFPGLL
jgi:hypothetical protein